MTTLTFTPTNKRKETKEFKLSFEHVSGNQFNVKLLNESNYTLSNGHAAIVSDGESFFKIREGQQIDNGIKMTLKKLNVSQIIINKIGGTKKDRFTVQIDGDTVRS